MSGTGYRVIYGLRTDAALYEADVASVGDPGGTPVTLARTNRLAPGGPRGEAIFCKLAITFQYEGGPRTIYVTPIVDEVRAVDLPSVDGRYIQRQIVILPYAATRTVVTVEVPVVCPYRRGGVDRLRTNPRGRWFQCEFEWSPLTTVIIDSCDVEYELVRERQRPL